MIYIDTSSLLKLFISDDHSVATDDAISKENEVVVSTLAELETHVQLRALMLGGRVTKSSFLKVRENLTKTITSAPFSRGAVPPAVFSVALAQNDASQVHCRSLDRIHLAVMAELGIQRLMSHDDRQLKAARELGFEVMTPGLA